MLRGMYIERRMHFNLIDNKSSTNFSIVALQSRFSRNERNLEDLQHLLRSQKYEVLILLIQNAT